MSQCIFCRIVNKEVPSEALFESANVLAFKDLTPQAPVHVLIVPKKHVARLLDVPGNEWSLWGDVQGAVRALTERFSVNESGFRLVVNSGPDAGQSVAHLHFHFLAGRRLGWPPG